MRKLVKVTREHIDSVDCTTYDGTCCPIAQAIKKTTGTNFVRVGYSGEITIDRQYIPAPRSVKLFVEQFDELSDKAATLKRNKKAYKHLLATLKPFNFYLELE